MSISELAKLVNYPSVQRGSVRHSQSVGVASADMTQGGYPDVPLNVVSVQFAKDALPTGDEGLPAKYSVLLGLSRRISVYELTELGTIWPGVRETPDRHWLVVPETTVYDVQSMLPKLQAQLSGVVERAAVVMSAAETLEAGERAELERRQSVMLEINKSLEPYRRPPVKEA